MTPLNIRLNKRLCLSRLGYAFFRDSRERRSSIGRFLLLSSSPSPSQVVPSLIVYTKINLPAVGEICVGSIAHNHLQPKELEWSLRLFGPYYLASTHDKTLQSRWLQKLDQQFNAMDLGKVMHSKGTGSPLKEVFIESPRL